MDINEITKSDIAENMKYKNTKYKKYETRFTAAESAVHQAKCNICKQNPILGFRFFSCYNDDCDDSDDNCDDSE